MPPDSLTIILPTHQIVTELYEDLATMSMGGSFDMNELMSLSVSALTVRVEAETKIAVMAGQYQRLAKVGQISEYNRDMEILSKAWLTFTTKLLAIYDAANIWDERGCANLYFNRLLGYDVVLTQFPPTDPPMKDDAYVYYRRGR